MFSPSLSARQLRRFTDLATISPDLCWEWPGSRWKRGYGALGTDKSLSAHRVAYFLANGPFDRRLFVCHRCDNPPCCNPAHLFLGTQADNMRDMARKGRVGGGGSGPNRSWSGRRRGEANPAAKLSARDVLAIRALLAEGRRRPEVAQLFSVSLTTVTTILNGRYWSHV